MTVCRHALTPILFLLLVLLTSCKEKNDVDNSITLTSSAVVELYSVVGESATFSFNASDDWTASCSADWVILSSTKGGAGSHTLKVVAAATNRTKNRRSAQVIIASGSSRKTVTVVQSGEYAVFTSEEYTIGSEGGTLRLSFRTNLASNNDLSIWYTKADWIYWVNGSRMTRAEFEGETQTLFVERNTSSKGRLASFVLSVPNSDGDWVGLDTAYVYQQGVVDTYESSDFSADGEVKVLQKSTQGKGITLVLMGDGYADRDIADSTYFETMYQAMENLFSEEPVRSLRDYFDVYAVTAVSRNSGIAKDHSTVFSCVPSNTTSSIDFDQNQIVNYTKKVSGIELDRAISVVIVNSSASNGVTALLVDESTKKPRQYAISVCCTIDSIRSETFRQVLTHEVIGHGLAKLADEYGYEANGAPTASTERKLKLYHQYNWMTNADTESDETLVLWNRFIGDPRFASENIGLYEGAYTYYMGVYRPTEESMMRHNESPFNAPSRKAIYDKVMELGEERPASTIDEFATFDTQHKPQRWDYSTTRSLSPWQQRRPAPPIIIYR